MVAYRLIAALLLTSALAITFGPRRDTSQTSADTAAQAGSVAAAAGSCPGGVCDVVKKSNRA
jgi:hypothetical protein